MTPCSAEIGASIVPPIRKYILERAGWIIAQPRQFGDAARRGRRPSAGWRSTREMPRASAASLDGQAGEVAELDQLGRARDRPRRAGQSASSRASRSRPESLGTASRRPVELDPLPVAAVLQASLAAGLVDQDAAHRLGRGGEEVAPAVPVLGLVHVDQPEIRLVDQGRGLERLAGLLLGQLLGGQAAQLARRPAGAVARRPVGRPARSPRGSGSLRSWRTVVPGHPLVPRSRPTPKRRCPGSARARPP